MWSVHLAVLSWIYLGAGKEGRKSVFERARVCKVSKHILPVQKKST